MDSAHLDKTESLCIAYKGIKQWRLIDEHPNYVFQCGYNYWWQSLDIYTITNERMCLVVFLCTGAWCYSLKTFGH